MPTIIDCLFTGNVTMLKHIYIIAGEDSGDFLGAQLIKALKVQNPDIQISGIGGALMQGEGLQSLFPMKDLSVMGVMEVLPRLFLLIKRIKQTVTDIEHKKPGVVVSIDAPDFSFRVIKGVKNKVNNKFPKFIHYVAPTVWAWRPKRAAKISKFLDGLICLFDFEPPYFEKEGLSSIAVGHPMMEGGLKEAKALNISALDTDKVGLFFGSRQGEIKRISPVILTAAQKMLEENSNIEFIAPTLPHLQKQITELTKTLKAPVHVISNKDKKWPTFKACDVAVAVSGTVGLELAAANVPHVIAYKMNNVTAQILKRVIKTPYAHLANIILKQEIVPEFIQDDCVADDIAAELLTLLENKTYQRDQTDGFIKVRESIGSLENPSKVAANFILSQA